MSVVIPILSLLITTSGCGLINSGDNSNSTAENKTVANEEYSEIVIADTSTQAILAASKQSPISGAILTINPGSLNVGESVSIREGMPLNLDVVTAELEIDQQLTSAGASVFVGGDSENSKIASPMTLSLPLGQTLAFQDGITYAVMYKVFEEGGYKTGVISSADIKITGNTLEISISFFGVYQAVRTTAAITDSKSVTSNQNPFQRKNLIR